MKNSRKLVMLCVLSALLTLLNSAPIFAEEVPVIDSDMTFAEAVQDMPTPAPKSVLESLELVEVRYFSFDGKLHQGQIVVRRDLVEEVQGFSGWRANIVSLFIRLFRFRLPNLIGATTKAWRPTIRPGSTIVSSQARMCFRNMPMGAPSILIRD